MQACLLDPSFQALVGLVDDVWGEMEMEMEMEAEAEQVGGGRMALEGPLL